MTALAMSADLFDREPAAEQAGGRGGRWALGALALAAALGALWGFFRVTGDAPVTRLHVEGPLERVTPAQIEQLVRPLLDAQFAEVDLQRVHDAVAALPWVARVRVEREWPATVYLRLWEREPLARWNAERLIDLAGVEFDPQEQAVSAALPQLSGPPGSAARVLDTWRHLAARLDGTPFALAALHQDARGDWTARTASGIELRFGRGEPAPALDMLLGPAARALAPDLAAVAHVDLRYTNGFSVGWRAPAAAIKGD